ncbi:energy transducer TonB [Pseudochryseolinea flava]|uniref:Energy transducer TonB n=1 Tax=Pseudochryseolinea flava TaxID=2059302 RepID=A0A364XXN3_9BACT|nr:energy transducer TonB [Pseudochryseolinea flava]RAV99057.1 energy transducer TonB [Pseudochryseolinea flava]
MKAEQVKAPRWEDIVFEYRNKAYGAYFIRKSYSKHVVLGWLLTILTIGLLVASPYIVEFLTPEEVVDDKPAKTVRYTDLQPPPPIQNTPPPPQVNIPPPVKTIIKYLPPKVTDKEIVEEEPMPTVEEIKKVETGSEDIVGTGEVVFDEPVEEVVQEAEDPNQVFAVVEQMPEPEGGMQAAMAWIGKNIKYPSAARRMGVEGTVFVGFVVDADGKIADVKTVKGISAECDKEAERVIKMMPPWKPGKQNGKAVRVKFVLPVRFKLAT